MDKARIKKAFGWLRTVQVDLITKSMDSGVVEYLKTSEQMKLVNEFYNYIQKVLHENDYLKALNSKLSAQNTSLMVEVARLEKERLELIKRVKDDL